MLATHGQPDLKFDRKNATPSMRSKAAASLTTLGDMRHCQLTVHHDSVGVKAMT
jgi:hypothetical protein